MENSFKKSSKKSFLVAIAILTSSIGFSQLAVPFKIRHQGYVKGDIKLVPRTKFTAANIEKHA
jgi:hypothetical protein